MFGYRIRLTFLALIVCVISGSLATSVMLSADSVVLQKRTVQGARLHVITVDLADPRIRIDIGLPQSGLSHSEGFVNMVRRRSPLAAVTGTYFDTRTLLPVGTIVVDGKVVYLSHIGTAVLFDQANRVKIVDAAKGESCDLTGAYCGLRTGPRLLKDGHYALNPRREGFRHPGLFGRRTRVAMGITAHRKLLLTAVSTPVTFARLASIMKDLGATDAVCLDGGTSSAMYYRGRVVRRPGRTLTNIIEVHARTDKEILVAKGVRTGNHGIDVVALKEVPAQPMRPSQTLSQPRRSSNATPIALHEYAQYGILPDTGPGSGESRHAFVPVYQAKPAGLKRPKHPENCSNVSAGVRVVYHPVV